MRAAEGRVRRVVEAAEVWSQAKVGPESADTHTLAHTRTQTRGAPGGPQFRGSA